MSACVSQRPCPNFTKFLLQVIHVTCGHGSVQYAMYFQFCVDNFVLSQWHRIKHDIVELLRGDARGDYRDVVIETAVLVSRPEQKGGQGSG